jgi:hypothetical protein
MRTHAYEIMMISVAMKAVPNIASSLALKSAPDNPPAGNLWINGGKPLGKTALPVWIGLRPTPPRVSQSQAGTQPVRFDAKSFA